MRIRVTPNGTIAGETRVPGDKSIAHRWLMLAATGAGSSRLWGLPPSLDVRSTAACLSNLTLKARPALDLWSRRPWPPVEGGGSTWNVGPSELDSGALEVEGEGRDGLVAPPSSLDCGNSGTSMRLLAGLLAAAPFRSVLTGDGSLRRRPMERVAAPLRSMGARIETEGGCPPITIDGGPLHGIEFSPPVPSAQLKSAVLLAGVAAEGVTTVRERAPSRDHTERALGALGAPVAVRHGVVEVRAFAHGPFAARVPGDPSSAAFLIGGAAITHSSLTIHDVGLNPTRLRFLDVLARMGVRVETQVEGEQLGEPVGSMHVHACDAVRATRVEADELPSVIDEVPVLAALAAMAGGDTWFVAAAELRVKESDRLAGIARGIRALGGTAADEGDDLVVAGGGLEGGRADAGGDHRMAMSLAVAALGARAACEIDGFEVADVSFPGFAATLRALGAGVEIEE